MEYLNVTLSEHRKRDMSTVLNFFLWLTRRSDINLAEYEPNLKDAIELLQRVRQTTVGDKIAINIEEFLMLYTCAQYTLKGMNSLAGADYITDTMLGDTNNYDWFSKQKKYFITISSQVINECKSRLGDLPDFAKERMKLEEQLHPF